jgi:hypothetical protein
MPLKAEVEEAAVDLFDKASRFLQVTSLRPRRLELEAPDNLLAVLLALGRVEPPSSPSQAENLFKQMAASVRSIEWVQSEEQHFLAVSQPPLNWQSPVGPVGPPSTDPSRATLH